MISKKIYVLFSWQFYFQDVLVVLLIIQLIKLIAVILMQSVEAKAFILIFPQNKVFII